MTQRTIRIANAGGYWGDDPYALRRQVQGDLKLDYISIDFLAEITMSILQKQKQKDPSAGYARDFLTQIDPLLSEILEKNICIITNAGGVNPIGCAQALLALAKTKGLKLRVAVVDGDNIVSQIPDILSKGHKMAHMDTSEDFAPVADKVLAANVYFGAKPVVEALRHKPNIVICGRVTDTGITLAPLIHEFGWKETDWDLLAHGIVAGHIIECGAQATGGNFTDWQKVPTFIDMGFPILECQSDGSFCVTKHPGTGGLVSVQTVREQLLYEMGHPQSYITPDVIADFSTAQLEAAGENRVRVSGVKGRPPTDLLKVSIAYADGYKSSGSIIISGPDARAKAEIFSSVFWERLEAELNMSGLGPVAHTNTEFVGHDSTHRSLTPQTRVTEILLKLSVRDASKDRIAIFRKLLPSLILSGPSGVAVTGGAPAISDVVSYWPALIPQELALSHVMVYEDSAEGPVTVAESRDIAWPVTKGSPVPPAPAQDPHVAPDFSRTRRIKVPLMSICHARSGDKGDTANVGLIARSPECYAWIRDNVTAAKVKSWFESICKGEVQRHAVPNFWALNFLLEQSLDGGGTMSLCIDAQGKTLSQALLRCEVEVPEALLGTIPTEWESPLGELTLR